LARAPDSPVPFSDAMSDEVPTGCSIFPKELQRPSRRWAVKRFLDIRYWNELDKGGHFAAFEQPDLFVNEARSFFRPVR
jgi:epoxide hydrolase